MPGTIRYPAFINNMVKSLKRRKILGFTVCCSAVLVLLTYWWFLPLKIIIESESGPCLEKTTYIGDTFSLRFTHSVHKTPVWENFVVEGADKLTLVSTEYRSYGVGMPSLPSEGTFIQKDDRFVLTNVNRHFSQIPVRVGPEAKLCFIQHEQEYPLYRWLGHGTLVHVRIDYDYGYPLRSK
ncbi:MAG: DUF1850 domain-containing protein [Veillonellaceae bacterium]|mgnify:CR=1 FL=1|jgi:hypothetical protein|nr:DUF1850 domain-containing protein [Veillonellaceae bacterium]